MVGERGIADSDGRGEGRKQTVVVGERGIADSDGRGEGYSRQ